MLAIQDCFAYLPDGIGAVVIHGIGDHFSSGLDLSELSERNATEGVLHSRMWHPAMDAVQFGRVPVVAVLHGAVVGGGLELASGCHIRVAEPTAYYGLPEGQRGIFVGGGGSVRVPRLVGVASMTDMMLTGRVHPRPRVRPRLFAIPYRDGTAFAKAMELAGRSRQRAADQLRRDAGVAADRRASPQTGLLIESLMAAIAQSDEEAKHRMRAFLDARPQR